MDRRENHVFFKICYGQLNIPIDESHDPGLDWLALWGGGFPNPRRLDKWGQSLEELRKKIESRFMVLPARDIVVVGSTKNQKKLIAPRVPRSFLERLPRVAKTNRVRKDLPRKGRLIWIGNGQVKL